MSAQAIFAVALVEQMLRAFAHNGYPTSDIFE
ncbi:hypothetical protein GCE9029_04108 [Grimontia celer]|uniref:Uncharacterized protein n=1 Tax=Grimontia celer TaxID=1796497 RepID=A0A128FAZ3_9GAMM|nr:hypothetical protein GCE9029_04108 [Grimontia celer]